MFLPQQNKINKIITVCVFTKMKSLTHIEYFLFARTLSSVRFPAQLSKKLLLSEALLTQEERSLGDITKQVKPQIV